MSQDRYKKIVLTVIAAGLWAVALALLQVATPTAAAQEQLETPQSSAREQERQELRLTPRAHTITPSTKVTRWRIPWARHRNGGVGQLDCLTAVSVLNLSPSDVPVDVDFFDDFNVFKGTAHTTVLAGHPDIFLTDNNVILTPFSIDAEADSTDFDGYALVKADDPRILVAAFVRCGENASQIASSITNIPAYPVGPTLAFFQTGMPSVSQMPPVAAPPEQ